LLVNLIFLLCDVVTMASNTFCTRCRQ